MLENFIYAKQKSLFEEALNNGEVLNEAIVFIEDTKEIWNHGTYFATQLSIDEIENIVSSSETVQSVMEQVVLDTLDSLPVSIISDGDGNKYLADDGSYKEISKEVFIITSDMFVETATTDLNSTLTFTDEGWSEFIKAIEANKIIVLDIAVASYIINSSTPYDAEVTIKGYFVLSYVTLVDGIVQGYFNVDMGEGIVSYNIVIISKSLTSTMKPCNDPSSVPYIFNYTNQSSVTQDEYDGLKNAINSQRQIVLVFSEGLVVISTVALFFDDTITLQYQDGSNIGGIVITSDLSTSIQFIGLATQESVNDLVPYIWNGTTSETIFNELKEAIENNRRIIHTEYGNVILSKIYGEVLQFKALSVLNNNLVIEATNKEVVQSIVYDKILAVGLTQLTPYIYTKFETLNDDLVFSLSSVENITGIPIVTDSNNGIGGALEYQGEFSFGDTVYTVTFPEDITWITYPNEFKADTTYQFEITNNIGKLWEVGKGEIAYKTEIPTKVSELEDGPSIVESIEKAKEVFIVTSDMFEQTSTTAGIPSTLTFTDEGWAGFVEAVDANKIIALDYTVTDVLINSATTNPKAVVQPSVGYFILNGLVRLSDGVSVNSFISLPSQTGKSPAIYQIIFENKIVSSTVLNTPSEVYILNISTYSTTEDFNNLEDAIENNKLIKVIHNGGLFDVTYRLIQTVDNKNCILLFFGAAWVNVGSDYAYHPTIAGSVYAFFEDGTCSENFQDKPSDITFNISGDGSKFLANDGTYKEISNAVTVNLTDSSITEEKYNEIYEAINNGIPINVIVYNEVANNFIGIKQADATKDPGGNVCLYYTVSDDVGHIRFCESFINSNDYSVTNLFTPINDLKNVYVFSLGNVTSSEDFTNLKAAIDSNKVIMIGTLPFAHIGGRWSKNAIVLENSTSKIILRTHFEQTSYYVVNGKVDRNIDEFVDITINSDGTYSHEYKCFTIKQTGSGSAFLSDDGTYKEISIPTKVSDLEDGSTIVTSIEEAKEVFIITSDMITQVVTPGVAATLTFTDESWSGFVEAVEANKIIGIDKTVLSLGENAAVPFNLDVIKGCVFSTHVESIGVDAYLLSFEIFNTTTENIDRYDVSISPDEIRFLKNILAEGHFIIDETMFTTSIEAEQITSFELTDEYKQVLARAIQLNKVIGISNSVLHYLIQNIESSNVNARGELFSGFSIINLTVVLGTSFSGYVYYGYSSALLRIDCSSGVITAEFETMLSGIGDGTKFLADDGTYKEINLDSKPAYHNIYLDNYSDNIMSSDDYYELLLAIENQVPIIIKLTGGNFIGSSVCDATIDPGGNITLFYTVMSRDGNDLRYFQSGISSNDLSIITRELFNSSKINLAIQPEDLATTTTSGLMSAEDKTKLDQITSSNTSIVTQAEYDALVAAGATTSGSIYYIRG